MRITWLFGNGLDLAFGLKTSYKDFYEYLLKKNLQTNTIFSQLKRDYESHREDLWSDYEIRLGQLTSQLSEDQLEQFEKDKVEIDLLLEEYLIEENKRIELQDQNAELLKKSFLELERCTREIDVKKIKSLVNYNSNSTLRIEAISFNYTSTVSLLWGSNLNVLQDFKIYGSPSSYTCVLEKPFYLHGALGDGEMIIGVNDATQIDCDRFKDNSDLQAALIKSIMLESAGQLHFEKFVEIINSSELICTYGLSLGATDACYWEEIKKKLLTSNSILIIYQHDSQYTNKHISLTAKYIKDVKKNFYAHSKASEEEIKKIDNRIIVEINHILFKK